MLSIFDGTEEQHSGRPPPHDTVYIYNSLLRDTHNGKGHDMTRHRDMGDDDATEHRSSTEGRIRNGNSGDEIVM